MDSLHNKVAIISGGATLIGVAVAEAFKESGATAVIADVKPAATSELIDFIPTDITDDSAIEACLAATAKRHGGVDYLVNVACTYLDNGMSSSRIEWLTALNVNVVGAAIFTAQAAPYLRQRGGGAVVHFSSISAHSAQTGRLLYATSKAAILGLTRNQALALAPDHIRVNAVTPGWTWSNVIRDLSGNDRAKADQVAAPFHLNGRLVDAEEVARTVVFLCSPAASGINGAEIAVDGGYGALGPEQQAAQIAALTS